MPRWHSSTPRAARELTKLLGRATTQGHRCHFGINFQLAEAEPFDGTVPVTNSTLLKTMRAQASLPAQAPATSLAVHSPTAVADTVRQGVRLALSMGVTMIGFALGLPEPALVAEIRKSGAVVFGTATTVDEALRLQEAAVDVIVAQGAEAGGHRGSFNAANVQLVSTMVLVPSILDALSAPMPVVAAGGVADGRGLAAALALGASGVQIGTRFLLSRQSGASAEVRRLLASTSGERTQVTDTVSGRAARAMDNAFLRAHANVKPLPYP